MRADVQKITKSGGKFEVRSKTAVIGVLGTSFVVEASQTLTGSARRKVGRDLCEAALKSNF
ncbi:MAG: FecR domain-containing protein [Acidobacteriota bacterium]|nr:FecR domain-containing protein [Acidobacteriota bacterium]